jgi:hypothetical protein
MQMHTRRCLYERGILWSFSPSQIPATATARVRWFRFPPLRVQLTVAALDWHSDWTRGWGWGSVIDADRAKLAEKGLLVNDTLHIFVNIHSAPA